MAPTKTLRTRPDLTRWQDADLTAREAELEEETDEEATAESSREFSAIEAELERRAEVRWANKLAMLERFGCEWPGDRW